MRRWKFDSAEHLSHDEVSPEQCSLRESLKAVRVRVTGTDLPSTSNDGNNDGNDDSCRTKHRSAVGYGYCDCDVGNVCPSVSQQQYRRGCVVPSGESLFVVQELPEAAAVLGRTSWVYQQ